MSASSTDAAVVLRLDMNSRRRIDNFFTSTLPRKVRNISHPRLDASFDHLVGARQNLCGHREVEQIGGLQVQHGLEFGRLLHREVFGFLAA